MKKEVRSMQDNVTDWIAEIDKIAERSIKRSKEILENLETENMEEIIDDNANSEDIQ
jgi:hypothetical protein